MSGLAAQKYGTAMPKTAGGAFRRVEQDTQQKKRSGLCAPCRTILHHVRTEILGCNLGAIF